MAPSPACQSKPSSEIHWLAAKKAGGLEDYVKAQAESIDKDALAKEAVRCQRGF